MNSPANYQTGNSKQRWWRVSLGLMLLAAGFIYVWILPLVRPRGEFLWGHYRLKDIYLGIPIALAAVCVAVVLAVPSRFRRTLSLRLVTLAISVLAALAICDVGYALGVMGAWRGDFWLDQAHIPRRYSAPDNELGFVRKPGVSWRGYVPDVNRLVEYGTDENGFRNPPGNNQADIVFIGDSFTEAATVAEEDTFARRVAKASGLTAVNLGRGAYGPQQELIVLKRYGLAYNPRVVVWQLFEGNDLADAEAFAEWMKNPRQVNTSLKERYINNSLLTGWLTNTRLSDRSWPMVTLRYQDGTVARTGLRYRYDPAQTTNRPLGLSETMSAIEAGYRVCQTHGIQLLITVVPTMAQVMEPNISFDRVEDQMTYLPGRKGNDQKDFSGRIEEFCTQIGCGFVDTFAAFRQAATNGKRNLYIPTDEHLDLGGHDVMAQMVVDWLRSTNIKA
jgi:hypothetical protein